MPDTFEQLQAQRAFVYDYHFTLAIFDEEREDFAAFFAQVALENFNRTVLH